MDWLQFISSIVSALAWPVAAVAVALIFRKQLVGLMEKLHSLEGPGIKAQFAARVDAVAQQSEAQLLQQVDQEEPTSGTSKAIPAAATAAAEAMKNGLRQQLRERFRRIAASTERPSAIVLSAWSEVEECISAYMQKHGGAGMTDDYRIKTREQMLSDAGVPDNIVYMISNLKQLRDKVAHSEGFEPDERSARDYAETAERVITVLTVLGRLGKKS